MYNSRLSRLSCLILGLFIIAIAGCRETLDATLTGTVTYQGKPFPLAMITFHPRTGGPMGYAVTDKKGRYEALVGSKLGLGVGTYAIALQPGGNFVGFPKKYGAIATSGHEVELKPGKNTYDIELE